jgi:hypothetical protein
MGEDKQIKTDSTIPGTKRERAEQARLLKAWHISMMQIPLPKKGCFEASYPSKEWREVPSTKVPPIPMLRRRGVRPIIVGNGNDVSAQPCAGLISSATGSFDSVTGVTSESGQINGTGPLVADAYTLQLNTNFFTLPTGTVAGAPPGCQGWEQFVFENDGTSGPTYSVYIQYWLINFGPTSPGPGWYGPYGSDWFKNSTSQSTVPNQPITNLANLSLGGTVSAGADSYFFSTGSGAMFAGTGDNLVNAAAGWNIAEFGVFGDGGLGQANFNLGSTIDASIVVRTEIIYGGTAPPVCVAVGFTGETNNLSFGPTAPPASGLGPAVLVTESSAGGAPTNCAAATEVGVATQPRPAESWAVSWGAGRLDVFGAGENNELLQRSLPPWTGPVSLGGTLGMIYPSAVSSSTGHLDVFGVGENRELLWWSFNDPGPWAGPVSLGGTLGNLFPSAVVSTVLGVGWCPGRLDVFGVGLNGELLHWWFAGGNWNGPQSFDSGMWTNSKPTVVSWGPGRLDVFGVGFDHDLLHRWFDGTSLNGPVTRGGNLLFSTSQSAVSSKTGQLDVFGVGDNNELLYWSLIGTTWTGPVSFDSGMWTSYKPSVVSLSSGRLDVFGEGEDNVLLHRWFDGTSWNGPVSRGGTLLTGAAPAAVSSNAGQLDVFGLGQNHDLLQWSLIGTTWTGPVSLDPGTWRSDVD